MRFFTGFVILLFLLSCASQGNLVGGAKDESPPKLLGANPQSESLNFSGNGFVLQFDENIQVKNLSQNLLISPFLDERPSVKVRPTSIEVEFDEELLPNTTYTFNFGNAIQDLNEGNELSGYTYVFSTGDQLDMATFTGVALDASTGKKPEEGAWALLYDSDVDSLFATTPPRYASPIDKEDGSFRFQNVKEGSYQLYALRDNNSNYYFDLPNEQIAFIDDLVIVSDSTDFDLPLNLFEPSPTTGFIRKAVSDQEKSLLIETSSNPNRFMFEFIPSIEPDFKSSYDDSIRHWFTEDQFPDSMFVYFDNQLVDTVSFTKYDQEITDTLFKMKLKGTQSFSANIPIVLKASRPFSKSGIGMPVLLEDSLFVAGGVDLIPDSTNASEYIVNYDFDYGKEYILQFDDSLYTDIYGLPSDSLGVRFTTPTKESLSVLTIDLQSEIFPNIPLIFQLMKGGEVYLTRFLTSVDQDVLIEDLSPGSYTVTLIIDENGNQQWDTGDYIEKRQPEQILVYETEIETRANWDVDIQINLDE